MYYNNNTSVVSDTCYVYSTDVHVYVVTHEAGDAQNVMHTRCFPENYGNPQNAALASRKIARAMRMALADDATIDLEAAVNVFRANVR